MLTLSPWARFWFSAIIAGLLAGGGAATTALTGDDPANWTQWAVVVVTILLTMAKDMQAKLAEPPQPEHARTDHAA